MFSSRIFGGVGGLRSLSNSFKHRHSRAAPAVYAQQSLAGSRTVAPTLSLATNSAPQSQPQESWPTAANSYHSEASASFPPGPPDEDAGPSWTDRETWARPLAVERRMFCNRSLNMRTVSSVGFDMDYTMAQYRPETFEVLAYNLTVNQLVEKLGYPKELMEYRFDWRYMVRGLTIDKQRGNVLKVDRHKYVKIAYHGFRQLPRDQRLSIYANSDVRCSFDEPNFAMIDTLFSLAEAHLFMQLVELQDSRPHLLPAGKNYPDLYRDVRSAVDLCHRDGSLKQAVASDPGKYIHADPRLGPMLQMLRASGRKVFLATNSLWDYTNVVMNFLLLGTVGKEERSEEWLEYFDVVVTGCMKPAFFEVKKPLFEVDTATGALFNTDNGTPMIPIGEDDLPALYPSTAALDGASANSDGGEPQSRARVFQGGTYLDLHKMLGVTSGAQVLYVGDHIYGDILRSKKTLGWRTMLVVPELETELKILQSCATTMRELKALRETREGLDDQIERLQWSLAHDYREPCSPTSPQASSDEGNAEEDAEEGEYDAAMLQVLENLQGQRDEVREAHRHLLQSHHEGFHKVWGQLMKTGYQNSRFAHQLERFACVYTSHVSNLSFYSPDKTYRARQNTMAHEEEPALLASSGEEFAMLDN